MWVVAVDAVIAHSSTDREIPVAGHPAVRSMVVVACLRSVALPAELHGVAHRDPSAVGAVKRRLIADQVAARARQLAVAERERLVELVEI